MLGFCPRRLQGNLVLRKGKGKILFKSLQPGELLATAGGASDVHCLIPSS